MDLAFRRDGFDWGIAATCVLGTDTLIRDWFHIVYVNDSRVYAVGIYASECRCNGCWSRHLGSVVSVRETRIGLNDVFALLRFPHLATALIFWPSAVTSSPKPLATQPIRTSSY